MDVPMADVPIDGRCFAYVFPCRWEDHCKIGFSRDPLGRIAALHPRWYEFFDLERGVLVEAESVRDARDLELLLRGPLRDHNAPAPLSVRMEAGGGTEWFRGVETLLDVAVRGLATQGYRLRPLQAWLGAALVARRDGLHEWTLLQLSVDELEGLCGDTPAQRRLRDQLDAFDALSIDIDDVLPRTVRDWYRR
ncbi:GIY-YIG nuclease family protein [Luteimonas yindakuii]|uniref:GIY-YIG nuclease family protein n=1 Tax=Luteimonas yindakuii TaxID=2565782 RepID=A0A4Z1R3W6_9GAMM|nr:GIY-YIG nuclease family protein [Luteimonas yindakuii]TKS54344.1 GIY-YIG nuclease family protein [Luteimonas yindakuii]